jgi:plastocyanin
MDARRVMSIVIVAAIAILALAGPIKIAREQLASADAEQAAEDGGAAGGSTGGNTVRMAGLKFAPATLTVARGTEVQFINDDTAPHTVTADGGGTDSGTLGPGTTFPLVVQEPFAYHCAIHPSMTAEIRLNG